MDLPHALHRASPAELKERIAAERRQRPFLLLRDGDGAQRILDLGGEPGRLTIGRSAASDVPLPWDGEVSRVHASLERVGDEWTFVDDGRSRNGSSIDGDPVHGRRRLSDGDTIVLGHTVLVFRSPTGRESLRTATSEPSPVPRVSPAQLRVLTALCRPYADSSFAVPASNRQIAEELVLGVETVKSHLHALFEAFSIVELPQHQKRAVLAQRALATGVVTLTPPAPR
ncbi:MAG TPA: FHA domain-containing protein [Baekduia sp.]|uniref:FHA domain-containing protein n=1 Tax=Baekduia sp. TaxID=2600305 RepID=UPI002B7363FF|nr:FHA domain-containing protein [Baekduia sp.]HMJ36712.1 FHA domain-containing protein [Baekduia sp.]